MATPVLEIPVDLDTTAADAKLSALIQRASQGVNVGGPGTSAPGGQGAPVSGIYSAGYNARDEAAIEHAMNQARAASQRFQNYGARGGDTFGMVGGRVNLDTNDAEIKLRRIRGIAEELRSFIERPITMNIVGGGMPMGGSNAGMGSAPGTYANQFFAQAAGGGGVYGTLNANGGAFGSGAIGPMPPPGFRPGPSMDPAVVARVNESWDQAAWAQYKEEQQGWLPTRGFYRGLAMAHVALRAGMTAANIAGGQRDNAMLGPLAGSAAQQQMAAAQTWQESSSGYIGDAFNWLPNLLNVENSPARVMREARQAVAIEQVHDQVRENRMQREAGELGIDAYRRGGSSEQQYAMDRARRAIAASNIQRDIDRDTRTLYGAPGLSIAELQMRDKLDPKVRASLGDRLAENYSQLGLISQEDDLSAEQRQRQLASRNYTYATDTARYQAIAGGMGGREAGRQELLKQLDPRSSRMTSAYERGGLPEQQREEAFIRSQVAAYEHQTAIGRQVYRMGTSRLWSAAAGGTSYDLGLQSIDDAAAGELLDNPEDAGDINIRKYARRSKFAFDARRASSDRVDALNFNAGIAGMRAQGHSTQADIAGVGIDAYNQIRDVVRGGGPLADQLRGAGSIAYNAISQVAAIQAAQARSAASITRQWEGQGVAAGMAYGRDPYGAQLAGLAYSRAAALDTPEMRNLQQNDPDAYSRRVSAINQTMGGQGALAEQRHDDFRADLQRSIDARNRQAMYSIGGAGYRTQAIAQGILDDTDSEVRRAIREGNGDFAPQLRKTGRNRLAAAEAEYFRGFSSESFSANRYAGDLNLDRAGKAFRDADERIPKTGDGERAGSPPTKEQMERLLNLMERLVGDGVGATIQPG